MSTSSKPKSGPPAHQNRTAFRHNKNSRLTKKIAETVTTYGLCDRCRAKQDWRVKYRKYKPLSVPRKCNKCSQKTVKAAYRTICQPCASKHNLCASCAKPTAVHVHDEVSIEQQTHDDDDSDCCSANSSDER